jgi:hypothetical protein
LPFERKYFEYQGVIFRLAASLEILADQTPDLLWLAATVSISGDRVLKQHMDVDCSVSSGLSSSAGGVYLF